MNGADTPVGLYSIGVRDLAMPHLLTWAADVRIPFVHLRGGVRGHAVLERSRHELEHWREIARATCPITVLTSDATLGELTCDDGRTRSAAQAGLGHACEAALALGARRVRILADTPAKMAAHLIRLPDLDVRLLIELHHPSWWTMAGLAAAAALVTGEPRIRLLADSAQAAAGLAPHVLRDARFLAARMIVLCDVLHLSDDGTGLDAWGHTVLAEAARDADRDVEVGFEWTGDPRTAEVCLRRYNAACAWWRSLAAVQRKDNGS